MLPVREVACLAALVFCALSIKRQRRLSLHEVVIGLVTIVVLSS